MSDSYAIIQERIQKALATIAPGTKSKVTRLAAEFNVPYDQLLNRYNRIPPKDSHSYALTDHKEQALHQYIQRLDRLRISYRRPMLKRIRISQRLFWTDFNVFRVFIKNLRYK